MDKTFIYIKNQSTQIVFLNYVAWYSGDVKPNETKAVEVTQDPIYNLYGKVGGEDRNWGNMRLDREHTLIVQGNNEFCVRPGKP